MRNCETCKHRGVERDGSNIHPLFCFHPDIRGRLRCRNCDQFYNLDDFAFANRQLRCKRCGCSQPMPSQRDPDCGFAGILDDGGQTTPEFCPGFESGEPEPKNAKRKPKPKKTPKPKFDPNQGALF